MVKTAWEKHLYNAYNSIKSGDDVYDPNGNKIGKNDGCFGRASDTSPGSVCLVHKGKFIWISGNVEKRENGWTISEDCKVE